MNSGKVEVGLRYTCGICGRQEEAWMELEDSWQEASIKVVDELQNTWLPYVYDPRSKQEIGGPICPRHKTVRDENEENVLV